MGLFDKLARMGKELMEDETVQKISEELKSAANSIEEKRTTIPEKYNEFPKFNGNISSVNEKNESKYERCTMYYKNISASDLNNYLDEITNNGYDKKTSVRYEKDNTYIIVDPKGNDLTLVFHIKR